MSVAAPRKAAYVSIAAPRCAEYQAQRPRLRKNGLVPGTTTQVSSTAAQYRAQPSRVGHSCSASGTAAPYRAEGPV